MQPQPIAYAHSLTIREALNNFFEANQLGADGGNNDNWVRLKFGRVHIPFPNFSSRKKAVMYHDIHHIVTGYPTTWRGEATVGAWEVASGCGSYTAAWVFDLGIFAIGALIFPRAVFHAFSRGRRSLNFFSKTYSYAEIVQMKISDAQSLLHLDRPQPPAGISAYLSYMCWWLVAFVSSFIIYIAPVAILIHYLIRPFILGTLQ